MNAAPTSERTAARDDGYRPFPNVARRNTIQEDLEIPALVRLLDVPTSQRVLEVGCGRGVALPRLAALLEPASLVGVDVDDGLLAEAERALIDTRVAATLVRADVRRLPFEDDSFDVVFDFGTCYHIARPGEALREISRVLRAGGRFVHETRVAQLVAHPTRFSADGLAWRAAPRLVPTRSALFWVWTLTRMNDRVHVHFDWRVTADRPLLRYLSPVLRPLFRANHNWAIARAREGLEPYAQRLARAQAASPTP